jgi:BolA protein
MKPQDRRAAIESRLNEALSPESLSVEDESHLHAGHAGARDGRGHFRVTVVAECFAGESMIKRHRMVYQALGEWMQTDIHALSIEAWSSDEL